MKIYNSMTGKKEEFKTLEEGKVKMYACGVTVYDLSHIGHARQAIVYAMIANYLRYRGYDVKYVRNYTDVDDKIINRANTLGKNALDFSAEQIRETEIDMQNLHVQDPDLFVKASEYIDKIIDFVSKLIEKGYAYVSENGDVYYIVRKFKDYGKLSKRNIDELLNGVRKDVEEGKRDPLDFALWKSAKPGEIYWESPWGKGRPGWHIECSVMAYDTLGEQIDIHGGGKDLVFPHHENEIAQSEALLDKEFAKYWSHCGLIRINGEKMSKSLGNSMTIRDALKEYNYEVLKLLFLENHYTTDIDIKDEDFSRAENHLYYFYNTIKNVEEAIEKNNVKIDNNYTDNSIEEKFIEIMDDDFNTALAISQLYPIFKNINSSLKELNKNNMNDTLNNLYGIISKVKEVYKIIGLFEQDATIFTKEMKNKYISKLNLSTEDVEKLIEERKIAKENKDYEAADRIREELLKKGVILKDSREKTEWDIKALYNVE